MADFNVQSYGAAGNGSGDDHQAILDAATAAIAHKGRLLFPSTSSFYAVSQGISLGAPNGLTISGYGATLKLSGDSGDQIKGRILYFDNTVDPGPQNIVIEGLTIDGNKAAQVSNTLADREQRSGIFMKDGVNIRIIDVTVQNVSGDGFQFEGAHDGSNTNKRILIAGCRWDTSGRHLCSFTDADGVVVASCFGTTAWEDGIHFEAEGTTPVMRRIMISGNYVDSVGGRNTTNLDGCITISGTLDSDNARGVVVADNTCVGQGIVIIGPRYCAIEGNTIANAAGTGTDGIAIQVRSAGVAIGNNAIEAPTQFGIFIDNSGGGGSSAYGQSQGTIIGNTIRNLPNNGATSEGIRLGSTIAVTVEGNTVVNDSATANTFGIRLIGGATGTKSDGNIVAHNTIVKCDYGIVEDTYSQNNKLLDNAITGSLSQPYSVVGTNTTLTDLRGVGANVGDVSVTVIHAVDPELVLYASPITANRTVTLSATNATPGARFRVLRTAAATGASTVSVGGLKNLAVGQWADVSYNTAWFLSGFGSL